MANRRLQVSLFCGGRGSATIIRELLRLPDVQLNLLVNAYDDGLTTGLLRDFIPGMLGPSDFRKNTAHLIELYSVGRFALSALLEYRFPTPFSHADFDEFIRYVKSPSPGRAIPTPIKSILSQLDRDVMDHVCTYLNRFNDFFREKRAPFEFADCSLGNLIFSGAYLTNNANFNEATRALSEAFGSRANLFNVTRGENRVLVALKSDGEILDRESKIVGEQTDVSIRDFYLLNGALDDATRALLGKMEPDGKAAKLAELHASVLLSPEAHDALVDSDVILFGPGTQYSSLFPSYKTQGIADAIHRSRATVRALIVNLRRDHDIQSLNATDIVLAALRYLGDPQNRQQTVTHIFYDSHCAARDGGVAFKQESLDADHRYLGAHWISDAFENPVVEGVHSGAKVVETTLALVDELRPENNGELEIYVDLNERSMAVGNLVQEFLELDWQRYFAKARLRVNRVRLPPSPTLPSHLSIESTDANGLFSEVDEFRGWLKSRSSQYFVSITGDGEYRLRDVFMATDVLRAGLFGAIFGARNQSRSQFIGSLKLAYRESRLLYWLGLLGGFIVSALCSARFQVIFADPLTGFRIYDRSALTAETRAAIQTQSIDTTLGLTRELIRGSLEIAEIPVSYRYYKGFTNMRWRLLRGLRNTLSVLFG